MLLIGPFGDKPGGDLRAPVEPEFGEDMPDVSSCSPL